MPRWMIELQEDAPPEVDDYVQGLEEVLRTHMKYNSIVNTKREVSLIEWTTGLLAGISFIQSGIVEGEPIEDLKEALLNLANIALTFNRSLPDGTHQTDGIREATAENPDPIQDAAREATDVQGSSEDLPEPLQHQRPASDGGDSAFGFDDHD